MLYLKQLLGNKWTPWSVDAILTEIKGDCRYFSVIGNRNIHKKCEYGFKQYLFVYRLALLKIIEILDCVLKDNKEKFIEPFKNIHFYYPFLLFIYSDIGLQRKKFLIQQLYEETGFDEIPNLAGDHDSMVNNWKEMRPRYLNYKGEIETLFASNGFKEFHIPIRLKIILEQVDQILDFQKKQYSPYINPELNWKKDLLTHNGKKLQFLDKKINNRREIVKMLSKNPNGLRSKDIIDKLSINRDSFKSDIRQLNTRLKQVDLTIKYDKQFEVYKLIKV